MLRKILPHAVIVLSGMYFVFFFIDKVNAPMAFINNNITKALLFILCVVSVINSISLIRIDRRRVRQQMEQRRRYAQSRRTADYDRDPYDDYGYAAQRHAPSGARRADPARRQPQHPQSRYRY